MATEKQIKEFITAIAPHAQSAYRIIGKVKPSVCIGMACVESAYGTAGSCKHHSYLGQKVGTGKTATKHWTGLFFSSKTKEEYKIGTHTTITAAFRAYPSMEMCVFNYYELLNTTLYARVKADADYKTQMQQIKACGYMTSSTEVNSVIKIIEKYNLTQYDGTALDAVREPVTSVRRGACGNGVKWIQTMLNNFDYGLKVDGIFGNKTENAVKDFQSKHTCNGKPLVVDGVVGAKTRFALQGGK